MDRPKKKQATTCILARTREEKVPTINTLGDQLYSVSGSLNTVK